MITDNHHVISTEQFFSRPILEKLFASAKAMKIAAPSQQLKGKILATVFYEPSTRTRFSFEAAMMRLGGDVITTEAAAQFSSHSKGETLEDSIKVISSYADAIVLRHPEVGSAERAAKVSVVPVINAGDGQGEHPTQALLDAFTINEELGHIDGLKIAMVGDLLNGRTIHSLLALLGLYHDIKVVLIAPDKLRLPESHKHSLGDKMSFSEASSLEALDDSFDVVYVTRVQKERFEDQDEYQRLKDYFVVNQSVMDRLGKQTVVMHPLPRVGEIDPLVDADPRAAYFRQAQNGLYVRMALLDHILGST